MNILSSISRRFGNTENLYEIENDSFNGLLSRGSCRAFSSEKPGLPLVRTLCAAALSSPTKSDLQQRDIVIVEDSQLRGRINAQFPEDELIQNAPVLLIFCGNNRRQRQIHEWHDIEFANDHLDAFFNASVDAAIALGAFVIAAEAIGLGCCPISQIRNHARAVSEIIELPQHVFPIAGMALGWPEQPVEISMRLPLESTVHIDKFSETGIREKISDYDQRRADAQPYANQRQKSRFGESDHYGWSEDKARQYSVKQRENFGEYIRAQGFKLD